MRTRLLGFLLFVFVLLWRATLRIRVVGEERRAAVSAEGVPILHVLWHQRMVLGILSNRLPGVLTMASRSSDGEVIAEFLRFWGYRVVRGSSSRGGTEAMRDMIREGRLGRRWTALTTDGPRGPARRSKGGVLTFAEAIGAVVLPVGTSSAWPKFLRSWDNFLVPLPFSRCACVYGEPLRREPKEPDEAFLARLDRAIDSATEEADRICGVTGAPRGRDVPTKGEADDA